jgi:hypothetical protein
MKKTLFALSLLVVAPMVKASEDAALVVDTTTSVSAPVVDTTSAADAPVEAVEAPVASVIEVVSVVPVVSPSKNIFAKGFEKAANGVSSVKNSTVNGAVFVKDGVFYAYDKVTGKIEAFTPNMILNARDSVRSTIANYPLTAVALTAFVTVKVANYFSDSSDVDIDEDDSF